MTSPAICTTDAEVRDAFGTSATVIGTYDLEEIRNAKGGVMSSWPVVRLADGSAVMIESVWQSEKRPDDATIETYRGKKVAVTGELHASPPGRIANMRFPCVSPVNSLEIVE